MRFEIVVALVIVHRHAATSLATVGDKLIGQFLGLIAWNAHRALKEGAELAINSKVVDAYDVLAVLVLVVVVDSVIDPFAQQVSLALSPFTRQREVVLAIATSA